jgi:hypothetical protein
MFDLWWVLKLHTSMSFHAMLLRRRSLVVLFLALAAAPEVFGQAANSPIAFANQDAITTSFVTAPNLASSSGAAPGGNTNWLKVEFHYGTTAALTTPFLDSVEFKIWIEGLDLLAKNAPVPGKGVAVALTGDITYVNVPAGKDLYGVVYVNPNTLARYSDDRGYEQFERKYDIHIEAYVGGALMDEINKKKEDDPLGWFKPFTVVPNLVYRQDQTPFIIADPDRYPGLKQSAPAPASAP